MTGGHPLLSYFYFLLRIIYLALSGSAPAISLVGILVVIAGLIAKLLQNVWQTSSYYTYGCTVTMCIGGLMYALPILLYAIRLLPEGNVPAEIFLVICFLPGLIPAVRYGIPCVKDIPYLVRPKELTLNNPEFVHRSGASHPYGVTGHDSHNKVWWIVVWKGEWKKAQTFLREYDPLFTRVSFRYLPNTKYIVKFIYDYTSL